MISILELAEALEWASVRARNELDIPTEKLMFALEIEAKGFIGEYQEGWAPLAESTLQGWGPFPGKIALGYAPPDNPLLRTGAMRASIKHAAEAVSDGAVGAIGSNDPIAGYQEFGTRTIPPRPFIGLAMGGSESQATVIFGEFALELLTRA